MSEGFSGQQGGAGGSSTSSGSVRDAFFDCVFLGCPRELPGPEPYVIFMDRNSDGFTETLIRVCRGDENFKGVARDVANIPYNAVVICDGPTWDREFETLRRAGVHGERVRVLLYFDRDASGFWDFAIACGSDLKSIFEKGLTAETLDVLAPFLEHYAGGRVSSGRVLPHSKFYTRDFLPMQVENGGAIARVMAAMADDQSRADYARILFGTNEQVIQAFSRLVFGLQQYMDIVPIRPGDTVVNIGVSRGWEMPYFLARLQGRGALHNIDPNMQYEASPYAAFIERFRHMSRDHLVIAGDRDGKISLGVKDANMIMSDMSQSSGDYEGDYVEFDSRSIDSLMDEGVFDRLDYLKMDVEGGEMTILKGAMRAISRFRPRMAIAIYHEPHHFWEYPAFILDNFRDYRFYLRQYGYSRFETLLYAVPMEAVDAGSGREGVGLREAGPESSPRTAPESQLIYHLHDRADQPRQLYNGPKRSVARVFGADWATASLSPGPWIDAETVTGVVERGSASFYLTLHQIDESRSELTIGQCLRGPGDVEWVASLGLDAGADCALVWPRGADVEVIVQRPSDGAAMLVAYGPRDGERRTTRQISSFILKHSPLAALWRGDLLEITCRQTEPGYLTRATLGDGVHPQITRIPCPPGQLQGTMTVRSYHQGRAVDQLGWAMLDGGRLDVYVEAAGRFEKVGSTVHDPRCELVATFVAQVELDTDQT